MKASDVKKAMIGAAKPDALTHMVNTGSALLNLACSGRHDGGFAKGKYYFLVGDSQSGKTFLTLTLFAEASIDKSFKDYRFIYDDVEGGAMMNMEKFFGTRAAERLGPPAQDEGGNPAYSQTIEEFYANLDDALQNGPCIYVLDSMDGLSSDYEGKKADERKKAMRKGTEAKGDYGDGKAKRNSSGIRAALADIRDTGSILIIVNQTRDNIGASMFEPRKTRSGGHALTFYATLEIWTSISGHIKKQVKGKSRELGVYCKCRVKKNRLTGRDRTVTVPIYHSVGIDDVGSCIDYLVEEGVWKAKSGSICVEGIGPGIKGYREKVVKHIEDNDLEEDLRELVSDTWNSIEEACEVQRKNRYDDE